MSEFLEADLDEITIEKIANHCSFENLKNVKTFDLSARLKEADNSILFKIMRVSYFFVKNSPISDVANGYSDVGDNVMLVTQSVTNILKL